MFRTLIDFCPLLEVICGKCFQFVRIKMQSHFSYDKGLSLITAQSYGYPMFWKYLTTGA